MTYRKEVDKVYKKIDSIAQKGLYGLFDYYVYIDDVISNSQYSVLSDVMITKYGIDMRKFIDVGIFKKDSYDLVRILTLARSQKDLNLFLSSKGVYSNSIYFYSTSNNNYIGDIVETDDILEATVGLESSLRASVPQFDMNVGVVRNFPLDSIVYFNNQIYRCIQSYIWQIGSYYAPDNSNYWEAVNPPAFSTITIDNTSLTLKEKYEQAINFLNSYNYRIPASGNTYIDSNYIDDYFL